MAKYNTHKHTYMGTTAIVLRSIIMWWMWICWWNIWWWVWSATTFFYTNRSTSSNIIRKSTPWMSHYRHPINHYHLEFIVCITEPLNILNVRYHTSALFFSLLFVFCFEYISDGSKHFYNQILMVMVTFFT